MIEIIWDDPFVKSLKKWEKKHPDLWDLLEERLSLFTQDPFHSSLRTHSLSGKLKGYWSFSINYEHRLVFSFLSVSQVLLIDIGLHDEVY